ncbi:MAG: hypothetical protein KQH63_13370 [Desulfobulbaceae bacterium]|nr:hypothetical protein [Desulfobulbaceae bacterium]
MSVFKEDKEYKRVIFNVDIELAHRLEVAKSKARFLGKKLDVDNVIDKALEKFLKKAEKKFAELGLDDESHTYDSGEDVGHDVTEESEAAKQQEQKNDKGRE